jgi:hypothetical protein
VIVAHASVQFCSERQSHLVHLHGRGGVTHCVDAWAALAFNRAVHVALVARIPWRAVGGLDRDRMQPSKAKISAGLRLELASIP